MKIKDISSLVYICQNKYDSNNELWRTPRHLRRDVFNFLSQKYNSVLCLQETYLSDKDHNIVRAKRRG